MAIFGENSGCLSARAILEFMMTVSPQRGPTPQLPSESLFSESSAIMADESTFHYTGNELDVLAEAANYRHWILEKIEPYLGTTIAEVGAGTGSVTKDLLRPGVQRVFAFEPSRNLFPLLTREIGIDERVLAINDGLKPEHVTDRVDSVVYINVLEHIEDDGDELSRAYAALRPNGHLAIFCPAFMWLYSEFDRHVGHFRRYTKASLIRLVEERGFRIVKVAILRCGGNRAVVCQLRAAQAPANAQQCFGV